MNRMKAHPRVFWHRLKDHVRRFGWIWLAVFLILSLVNNRWHLAMNRSHSLPFKLFVIERGKKTSKSEITLPLNLSHLLSAATV